MDYEKKYKELVKRVKEFHKEGNALTKAQMEIILPELKESEDEKIRKAIVSFIDEMKGDFGTFSDIKLDDMVAWLEKQGEQKSVFEMKSAEESLGIDSDTYNKIVDECIYGEQKPAWSEEDKDMVDNIFKAIQHLLKENDSWGFLEDCLDWLKSLKNRVQPQQKQDWSVNDERILYNIHSYIDYAKDSKYHTPERMAEAKGWLDSLKNRVQSHWKPTEEQLQTLKDTINHDATYTRVDVLESLINDLKKL